MIVFLVVHLIGVALVLFAIKKIRIRTLRFAFAVALIALVPIQTVVFFLNRYVILAQLFFLLGQYEASKKWCSLGCTDFNASKTRLQVLIDERYLLQCWRGFALDQAEKTKQADTLK